MGILHQTLELGLIKRYDRPVFEYDETLYMFDSGSDTPVWCSGEDLFLSTFKNAYKTEYDAQLSGFGRGYTPASIYVIPQFILKDDNVAFEIENLYVAVADYSGLNFDFILSNTMFSKTDNTIANSENLLRIQIFDDRPFICTPHILGKEVHKISVWTNK